MRGASFSYSLISDSSFCPSKGFLVGCSRYFELFRLDTDTVFVDILFKLYEQSRSHHFSFYAFQIYFLSRRVDQVDLRLLEGVVDVLVAVRILLLRRADPALFGQLISLTNFHFWNVQHFVFALNFDL